MERNLISSIVLRPYCGLPPKDFHPNATCNFHFRATRHSTENCKLLKHRVEDLIDHGILKFEGVPNIKTNPLRNHLEKGVSAILIEEDDRVNLNTIQVPWRKFFYALKAQGYLGLVEAHNEELSENGCEYHSNAQGHSLEDCEEFKKEVASLADRGIIRKKTAESARECMMIKELKFTPMRRSISKIEYCERRKSQKEESNSSKSQSTVVTVLEPRRILSTTPIVIQFPILEKDEVQASIISTVQP